MTDYLDLIVQRHARQGILVDTNLLLLLVIGQFERELILSFKRTASYSLEDYDTLLMFVGFFDKLITTPNILTEISNFVGQLADPKKLRVFEFLRDEILLTTAENYLDSNTVAATSPFTALGLTYAAVAELAGGRGIAVLTDDLKLYRTLTSRDGIDAVNFNHLRNM